MFLINLHLPAKINSYYLVQKRATYTSNLELKH